MLLPHGGGLLGPEGALRPFKGTVCSLILLCFSTKWSTPARTHGTHATLALATPGGQPRLLAKGGSATGGSSTQVLNPFTVQINQAAVAKLPKLATLAATHVLPIARLPPLTNIALQTQ